jgi:3' terminal RNA ribose 2'-O-methyltransferase Hen1
MLLTLTTTHRPATDLGFLLHKNPGRVHTVDLSFGQARVVYPEADEDRCTAALIVDVDPVGLVRDRRGPKGNDFSLAQYVNDRPYAASSFLSAGIGKLFGTAMSGRSKDRPELVDTPLPFEVALPVVPCRGGEPVLRALFEPLGYTVEATAIPLDAAFPEWGDSRYFDVRLTTTAPIKDVLEHVFVLLPVLDDDKHYWVGADEVDKLLRRGGAWLATHSARELIAKRYLRHDRKLMADALARLLADDDVVDDPDETEERHAEEEAAVEKPIRLNDARLDAVVAQVQAVNPRRVVDLGCGGGNLLQRLLRDTNAERVVGVDVSYRALEFAARKLHLDTMAPRQRERVELLHGALTYRDKRIEGFDVAAVVEVIEHLDPPRLGAFERVVFGHAQPTTVIVTTPNVEYNALFETMPEGALRHRDHRFEWTRAEFTQWADAVAARHGYAVTYAPIGPVDEARGAPTQMAVFRR